MGQWDEYCLICGGPPYVSFTDMQDDAGNSIPNPPNDADYKWLEDFVGVTTKEELIKLGGYDGYGNFDVQPNPEGYLCFDIGLRMDHFNNETDAHGHVCHVKCHTLLQKELGYSLRYQDVRPLLVVSKLSYEQNKFEWCDYGGMANYQDQYFIDHQVLKDGNLWMLEDPCENEANAQRILALWRPLLESGFAVPEGVRAAAETTAAAADAPSSARNDADGAVCTPSSTTVDVRTDSDDVVLHTE